RRPPHFIPSPYPTPFRSTTLSPTFTASARTSPLSKTRPVPTATISPRFGFSAAEPGRTIPPAVLVSSSLRRITTRSCRGRSFIVDLLLVELFHADGCHRRVSKSGGAGCGSHSEPLKTDCQTRQRPCGDRLHAGAENYFKGTGANFYA